jgi:hypothetical protein
MAEYPVILKYNFFVIIIIVYLLRICFVNIYLLCFLVILGLSCASYM